MPNIHLPIECFAYFEQCKFQHQKNYMNYTHTFTDTQSLWCHPLREEGEKTL